MILFYFKYRFVCLFFHLSDISFNVLFLIVIDQA